VPHRPVGTVAEQMRQLDAEPKPKRSNAQRPVPHTGIEPRTRAEAELFEDQPLPGFQGEQALEEPAPPTAEHSPAEDPPVGSEEEPPPDMVSSAQMKRLQAGFTALGIRNREQRITIIGRIVGRQVESANDLYRAEAATHPRRGTAGRDGGGRSVIARAKLNEVEVRAANLHARTTSSEVRQLCEATMQLRWEVQDLQDRVVAATTALTANGRSAGTAHAAAERTRISGRGER
jgi:hypothetical protein